MELENLEKVLQHIKTRFYYKLNVLLLVFTMPRMWDRGP
jgi:hypothetical protein